MTSPRANLFGEIVQDDDVYSAPEGVFHFAVAPTLRLEMQSRIMTAAHRLQKPVSKSCFYAAALQEEDAHLQTLVWSVDYEILYLSVLRRCWSTVDDAQKAEARSQLRLA